MGQSIFGQFSLLVTLAFALPAMAAGADMFFVQGNTTWGAALIAIGVLMILMEKYVDNPLNPGSMVGDAVVEAAVKEPEDLDDEE